MKMTLTPEKRGLCTITPHDLREKFAGYLNTLSLHQDAGRDHAFCQEALDGLLELLDQVEAGLPDYGMIKPIF